MTLRYLFLFSWCLVLSSGFAYADCEHHTKDESMISLCDPTVWVLNPHQLELRIQLAKSGDGSAIFDLIRHYRALDDERSAQVWVRWGSIKLHDRHYEADHAVYLASDPQTQSDGIKMLEQAARRGNGIAAYQLSKAYEEGLYGLPKDLATAERWREKEENPLTATRTRNRSPIP